jgi:uncharacterized membrane protein
MVDRWAVFVVLQFVSAIIGFLFGLYVKSWLFIMVGFFFFAVGAFSATRWGFDKWRSKQKPRKREKK